ncbi:MAG: histidine phosphatase family protein [Clostridiales bacterium]|nr:histidine phosphatase family protein [Clostridiales bacterium]
MIRLYLVRHGQTVDNHSERLSGWSDTKLSDLGKKQVKNVGEAFKKIDLDYIYTSDLRRAKDTALAIYEGRDIPFIELKSLREIHFGDLEGHTLDELRENYPQIYAGLEKDNEKTKFPNGESLEDMHNRVSKVVDEILEEHNGKNILLVAHSGVIRSIIAHLITGDIRHHWNFKIDNCSISIIECENGFNVLDGLNDKSHLKDLNKKYI